MAINKEEDTLDPTEDAWLAWFNIRLELYYPYDQSASLESIERRSLFRRLLI
jgi:hypothetical protein